MDLMSAAKVGTWIELDEIWEGLYEKHLVCLKAPETEELWDQVLLSHDDNSMRLSGRPPMVYEQLFTVPMLKSAGFNGDEIEQVTVRNHLGHFTISRRLLP